MNQILKKINSEKDLSIWARKLGGHLKPGLLISLEGELGTGKTTFLRYLCQGIESKDFFSAKNNFVHSPTFSLIHEYPFSIPVIHVDLYRLGGKNPLEVQHSLEDLGFRDYLTEKNLVFIEWFNRLPKGSYDPDLSFCFSFVDNVQKSTHLLDLRELGIFWTNSLDPKIQAFLS